MGLRGEKRPSVVRLRSAHEPAPHRAEAEPIDTGAAAVTTPGVSDKASAGTGSVTGQLVPMGGLSMRMHLQLDLPADACLLPKTRWALSGYLEEIGAGPDAV